MSDAYVLTIGYVRLAFADKDAALRAFDLFADAVPVEAVSAYGSPHVPDDLKRVCYVRDKDRNSVELKRFDSEQFALNLTAEEFREQLKPRPVEPDDGPPAVEPSAAESIQ